jgi:hypothetical protein
VTSFCSIHSRTIATSIGGIGTLRAQPGLGFARFIEGDVGFSDLDPAPTVGWQLGRSDAEHHDLRWPPTGEMGDSGHEPVRLAAGLSVDRVDRYRHRSWARQRADIDAASGAGDLSS